MNHSQRSRGSKRKQPAKKEQTNWGNILREKNIEIAALKEVDEARTREVEQLKADAKKLQAEFGQSLSEYKKRVEEARTERDMKQKELERLQESEKVAHLELADLRDSTKNLKQELNEKHGAVVKELKDRVALLEGRAGPGAEALGVLKEVFAAIAHQEWSDWVNYMFSCGKMNEDEDFVIPKKQYEDWLRKRMLRYRDLTESEQRSDVISADKYVEALRQFVLNHVSEDTLVVKMAGTVGIGTDQSHEGKVEVSPDCPTAADLGVTSIGQPQE